MSEGWVWFCVFLQFPMAVYMLVGVTLIASAPDSGMEDENWLDNVVGQLAFWGGPILSYIAIQFMEKGLQLGRGFELLWWNLLPIASLFVFIFYLKVRRWLTSKASV